MRKVEVNEDDLKKVILLLKLSKGHIQIPPNDLVLANLWRVAGKLADKLIKVADLTLGTTNGRVTLKRITVEADDESRGEKTPRCRKRKK